MELIRETKIKDCFDLAANIRAEDAIEISLVTPEQPLNVIVKGWVHSTVCFTIFTPNNELAAIYGVNPILGMRQDVGLVWLLGTDHIAEHKIKFLRNCTHALHDLFKYYKSLSNYCWAGNGLHVKWLKWLGFDFIGERYFSGERFIQFVKDRPPCASR